MSNSWVIRKPQRKAHEEEEIDGSIQTFSNETELNGKEEQKIEQKRKNRYFLWNWKAFRWKSGARRKRVLHYWQLRYGYIKTHIGFWLLNKILWPFLIVFLSSVRFISKRITDWNEMRNFAGCFSFLLHQLNINHWTRDMNLFCTERTVNRLVEMRVCFLTREKESFFFLRFFLAGLKIGLWI